MARIEAEKFVKLFANAAQIDDAIHSLWSLISMVQTTVDIYKPKGYKIRFKLYPFRFRILPKIIKEYHIIKIDDTTYYKLQWDNIMYTYSVTRSNISEMSEYSNEFYKSIPVISYEDKKEFVLKTVDKYYTHLMEDDANIKEIAKIADVIQNLLDD